MPRRQPALEPEKLHATFQRENEYVAAVRELRRKKLLHPFVAWRLQQLVNRLPASAYAHLQPEKHGISNGRIDLAGYLGDRSIIHFEFIAYCGNGHVFRDTTSLLASNADSRLAILIDEDVDPDVVRSFVRAIPCTEVPHIFLRTLLLDARECVMLDHLRERTAQAIFVGGSLDPSSFHCEPSTYCLEPGRSLKLTCRNVGLAQRIALLLRLDDELVGLGQYRCPDDGGQIEIWIPRHPSLIPRRARLLGRLDTDVKWSRHVTILPSRPAPSVTVSQVIVEVGDEVTLNLGGFTIGAEIELTFFNQEGCGVGVGRTLIGPDGAAMASVRVPTFIGGRVLQEGEYKVEARSETTPEFASAVIRVRHRVPSLERAILLCSASANAVFGVVTDRIVLRRRSVTLEYRLMNFARFPVRLVTRTTRLLDDYSGRQIFLMADFDCFNEATVAPGQELAIVDVCFPVAEFDGHGPGPAKVRGAEVTITASALGHMIPLSFVITLSADDMDFFHSKDGDEDGGSRQ